MLKRLFRNSRHAQNVFHAVTPSTMWLIVYALRALHKMGGTDKSSSVRHKLQPGETLVIRQVPLPQNGAKRARRPSITLLRKKS